MNKETESYVTWLKKATENQVNFSIEIYENKKQLAYYFKEKLDKSKVLRWYLSTYYESVLKYLKPDTLIYEIDFCCNGEKEYYDDPELAFHVLMNIELKNKDTL